MPTPTHCAVCRAVLAADSPSGLCPTCQRSATPRDVSSLLVTDDPAATRTFADRVDPAAETRAAPPSGDRPVSPAPPAPDPDLTSHRIPPGYVALQKLGGGGMGLVYKVWEVATEREVALKLMRAGFTENLRDRFGIEVKALATVADPNVVKVLYADLLAQDPYFTMEYVDGEGLDKRLKAGPLPADEAARLMETVARSVHAAHEAGVIHRDLKPSNIIVTPAGEPKVTDFGVAKREGVDESLTSIGMLVGTPAFMSPEQANGKEVDRTADVYGLGATLFALLTGQPPFQGPDQLAIVALVKAEAPPLPRSLRPGVPPGLEAVVLKCLAKDPARRYATAKELADELAAWRAGRAPKAKAPSHLLRRLRSVRSNVWTAPAATVLVTAVTVAAVWLGINPTHRSGVSGATVSGAGLSGPSSAEQVRDAIRKEKTVRLLGAKGHPDYYLWRLGGAGFGASPTGDDVCYVEAIEHRLLELVPDPGIDTYRVEFEVRQLSVAGGGPVGGDDHPSLGPYFGYCESRATDGRPVHAFLNAVYTDLRPNGGNNPDENPVRFRSSVLATHAEMTQPFLHIIREASFPRPAGSVGEWRTFRIDVSPERVSVEWQTPPAAPQSVATLSADAARREYAAMQARLARGEPGNGAVLQPWSPRMPIGVLVHRSAVTVRNVTITRP